MQDVLQQSRAVETRQHKRRRLSVAFGCPLEGDQLEVTSTPLELHHASADMQDLFLKVAHSSSEMNFGVDPHHEMCQAPAGSPHIGLSCSAPACGGLICFRTCLPIACSLNVSLHTQPVQELATCKPLSLLATHVPAGLLGRRLIEGLQERQVPPARAAWFVQCAYTRQDCPTFSCQALT